MGWTLIQRMKGRKDLYACVCGVHKAVDRYAVNNKKSTNCGCLRSKNHSKRMLKAMLPKGERGLNNLYSNYKWNAKTNNREFTLSIEDFKKLTSSNCKICNKEPSNKTVLDRRSSLEAQDNSIYIYNGIDRIDNLKGYTLDNCQTLCEQCNRAKYTFSTQEFEKWISRILKVRGYT